MPLTLWAGSSTLLASFRACAYLSLWVPLYPHRHNFKKATFFQFLQKYTWHNRLTITIACATLPQGTWRNFALKGKRMSLPTQHLSMKARGKWHFKNYNALSAFPGGKFIPEISEETSNQQPKEKCHMWDLQPLLTGADFFCLLAISLLQYLGHFPFPNYQCGDCMLGKTHAKLNKDCLGERLSTCFARQSFQVNSLASPQSYYWYILPSLYI